MTKKILIVDDEPDILAVTVTRLETSGYSVSRASSAEIAFNVIRKDRPDLILLDILLPCMQGDEFCKSLKHADEFKDIPVVLFTASTVHISHAFKDSKADDYVIKPFEPEELVFKIKRLIG